jgi:integrase
VRLLDGHDATGVGTLPVALTTVAEFFDLYREAILANVRPHTASGYEVAWRCRVRESFGHRVLDSITTWEIEAIALTWPVKYSTKRDALACLSKIMRAASKAGLVKVNPCRGVELGRQSEGEPTGRALSKAEVGRLLALLPSSGVYRRFVVTLLFTGMRIGELAGLTVGDCDVGLGLIRVSKTASPGRTGERVVGPTKNGKTRLVPIAVQLRPVVQEACVGKAPEALAFPGPMGGYLNSKNLSRALKWPQIRELIKRFPPGEPTLHWHDLRHTALTNLALGGLVMPDLMAVAGHSSLQVTQRYLNTKADAAQRAASIQSDFYADFEVTPPSSSEGGGAANSPALQGS